MTKGKSHNRTRSGTLKKIRRGQARKLRAIKGRERANGYPKGDYDGNQTASEES